MSDFLNINLAQSLKVKPEKVIDFLNIPLGKKVKKGDLLAKKKGLLSSEIKVYSKIDGILEKLDESTGIVKIIKSGEDRAKQEKPSHEPDLLAKTGEKIKGIFGFGKNKGKLDILKEKISIDMINEAMREKIIAAPKLGSRGVLYKAAALDIAAIIIADCSQVWQTEFVKAQNKLKFNLAFLCLGKEVEILSSSKNKLVICDGDHSFLKIIK
jgi:hypothetical protein